MRIAEFEDSQIKATLDLKQLDITCKCFRSGRGNHKGGMAVLVGNLGQDFEECLVLKMELMSEYNKLKQALAMVFE
jgi:hypothetical protein